MTKPAASSYRPSSAEDWGIVGLGYSVMAIAVLVLVGWWLNVSAFVTTLAGLPPMTPGEAVGFVLLGLVTVLVGLGRGRHRICVVASVLAAGIAGLSLGRAVFGVGPATAPVGMGINTAAAIFLLASSNLLRGCGGRRVSRRVFVPALLAGLIALVALAGYVGRYELGYRWGASPGMAIHASVCLLLLALASVLDAWHRLSNPELYSRWSLSLAGAGFIVLMVSWVAYRGFVRVVDVGREIVQAHAIDHHVRDVQLSLTELEARRNAFLLTRDTRDLGDDAGEKERLRAAVVALSALAVDPRDGERRLRIDRLAALVEELLARHDDLVRAVTVGESPGIEALRAPADLELRAELQAVIRRIHATEAELLTMRQAGAKHAINEARGVIVLGALFVFVLGGGAVLLLRRLLNELAESRERFASVFASVAEGLVLRDRQGRILECNAAAERVLGADAAELARRGPSDPGWGIVHEDGSPCPVERLPPMVALRAGESQRERVLGVHRPDGTLVWLSVNSEPIRDTTGAVCAVVSSFFDITARRSAVQALRDSEERFRSTFDHAGIGMAIVGLDGRWLRVNRALLRIIGYDEAWLLARSFQDVTHPDDLEMELRQVRRLIAGELTHYQLEKRYFHADGHVVWIHMTNSLVRDAAGAPTYFVTQIEDITERKRAEEKLAAYAARLAEKNRELQDFAYVASHDLQEPLRKIQAFGDRLDQRAGERLAPDERDYLSRMRAAAARMSNLIEALLAYSRVASETRGFETVSLDRALQEALQDLELRVERTRGRIEAGPLPALEGDPVQLRLLFQNLVGNALKYHRPDLPPVVRISAAPAPAGALPGAAAAWEISVEDNGIGFEPRHAETIFGVFHRLHARGEYEGTGVGLAICRRIVDRHGGVIRAEGRPGEGARFVVTLPAVRPREDLGA